MKKVLFTDLIGTLISPDLSISRKFFTDFDRELAFICRYINEFLSQDNYLAIVTEPGGHGNFGSIFNDKLAKLDSYIAKNLRSHIAYYLQGTGKINKYDNITKENINGKTHYVGKNSFKGIAINRKEEAINDFLSIIEPPYQVYAIGDSARDIPMLLRTKEINGKSSVMDTYLYRFSYGDGERSLDQIIKHQLYIEFDYLLYKMNEKRIQEGRIEDYYNDEELLLFEAREKRKNELYNLLYEGKLDLDKMDRDYSKHLICKEYDMLNNPPFSKKNKFYESYPFSEEVVSQIMELPCYASFSEYYTKVLKR